MAGLFPSNKSSIPFNITTEDNIINCQLVKSNMWFVKDLTTVYIINCVLNSAFAIVAVVGNFIVLYAIIKTPSLHKPSMFFICNLTATDLAVGLLVQPLYVVYKVAEINGLVRMSCYCGVVVNMLANLLSGMSFITITCISIDRYLALYLHLRYVSIVTTQKVAKTLVLIWTVNIIFVTFYPWKTSIALGYGLMILIICLFTATFTFMKIHRIVQNHRKKITGSSAQSQSTDTSNESPASLRGINVPRFWKSVLTMKCVYLLLLLFYFPYMATLATRVVIGLTKEYKLALNITTTVIYINSSINPVVYCLRLGEIRKAVLKVLGRQEEEVNNSGTFLSSSVGNKSNRTNSSFVIHPSSSCYKFSI